jgi:hypothetical protein
MPALWVNSGTADSAIHISIAGLARSQSPTAGRSGAVFSGNSDQSEKGMAPCVDEGGTQAMRGRHYGGWANRPVGGDRFTRGVEKVGRKLDEDLWSATRGLA